MIIRRNTEGFTLIELLVVIAVLVLLIALLMPMMGKAVDATRKRQCSAQLHDIGGGFSMYAGDDNDYIPKCATAAWPLYGSNGTFQTDSNGYICFSSQVTWQTIFVQNKYVPRGGQVDSTLWHAPVFVCPLDPRASPQNWWWDCQTSFLMPTYYYGCWPVPQGWDPNMPMSHAECAGVLDGCYHFYSWCNPATNYPEGFRNAPMAHVKRSQVQQPNNTMQLLEGIGWPGGTYDYWDCTECWGGNDWNVTNGWGTPYNSRLLRSQASRRATRADVRRHDDLDPRRGHLRIDLRQRFPRQ